MPCCALQAFKVAAAGITRDYFASEDATDAAQSLAGLDEPELLDVFVKQVCSSTYKILSTAKGLLSALLVNNSSGLAFVKGRQPNFHSSFHFFRSNTICTLTGSYGMLSYLHL